MDSIMDELEGALNAIALCDRLRGLEQQENVQLYKENQILHQALQAIATPQEYKLVMDEIKNSLQKED